MPECLDYMPWSSLRGLGTMAPAILKVGDYKNDKLKDGSPVQFRLIGLNHDVTKSGLVVPMTWEMVDCMPQRYPWNKDDTNEGSWPGSYLFHQMNDPDGEIYRLMPDQIVEFAVPILKRTGDVYGGREELIESEQKFFIKSEKETFGRTFYSVPGEGHWYEWYRQEDVPWYKLRDGRRDNTMLRSPVKGDDYSFCLVYTGGDAYYHASRYANGLAPAFGF